MDKGKKEKNPSCFDAKYFNDFLKSSEAIITEGLEEIKKISLEALAENKKPTEKEVAKALSKVQCTILEKVSKESEVIKRKLNDFKYCMYLHPPKTTEESEKMKKEVEGLIKEIRVLLDEMKTLKKKKCG